jgi:Exonuclease VII small subunit
MKKSTSFEAKLSEIENIIFKLQSQDTPLEDSINLYKQAVELLSECKDTLKNTELEIEKINSELILEEEE